jgi:hypothetical protein
MIIKPAIPSLGFDVNQPLTAEHAAAFKAAGYDFCIRYLPRTFSLINGNLTKEEIEIILGAGLNLMAVQHVSLPGWQPNAALGTLYGKYAAQYATEIGLLTGINIWLDLEEVVSSSTVQNVIDYCKAWYTAVEAAGYVPGIYVGYGVILSPEQLHDELPFKHYWNAYNGPGVATRGCQLLQRTAQTLNGITFDPNDCQTDKLGDLPIWLTS